MTRVTLSLLGLLLVAATIAAPALACDQCACGSGRKICRLVPDVKKITTFCYSYECEDICLNGRSKCVGTQEVCTCRGPVCKNIMQPTCCEILTRRVLTKVPVVTEKHGWKCVVETVCCGCGNPCTSREATEAESKIAISNAEKLGVDPATATTDVFVPFDDQVQPASANMPIKSETTGEPATARKSTRFMDLLFRK